jgi:cellulose biosynthesis protein BcsQ
MVLQEYIQDLAKYFKKQGKELVVFIDTNPALSIYTQIALVAMTELIIPVNADCFSMQASQQRQGN